MAQLHRTFRREVIFLGLALLPACAQNVQFLPEVDTYVRLNSVLQMYVEAKSDQDAGDPLQAGIGPSLQLYLDPLLTLKKVTVFDLDNSKKRLFVLEIGYRYIAAPNTPTTNRMLDCATFNFPLRAGFHLSDRSRADLDWTSGNFMWRYRNKLIVERTVAVSSYHLIPYVLSSHITKASSRNGVRRPFTPVVFCR